MCILFIYNGTSVEESDYSLIIATNRDEFYDRPAHKMHVWVDDPLVVGGYDLEPNRGNGTWLALSPIRRKLGVLLNLPIANKPDAKSRGKIVSDYVKSDKKTSEYITDVMSYVNECNGFILITAEFGAHSSSVFTYTNVTNKLIAHADIHLAFGNSLPETPLKKVEAGRSKMKDICHRLNKRNSEKELVEKLIELLKSEERNLPDHQLETRQPETYEQLSSNFVRIPKARYGTRTHTILLVTKKGHFTIIELTMKSPINLDNVEWHTTELYFDINLDIKL